MQWLNKKNDQQPKQQKAAAAEQDTPTRVHVSLRFSAVGTNNRNRKYWVHTPADGVQIIAVDSPYSTLDARINNRVRTCT